MKFNLTIPYEQTRAKSYFNQLLEKKTLVEIKRLSPKRSLSQNAYLHLIIGAFGMHFGYHLDEAKQVYKELNASIYSYEKKGRTFWRSSADLSKDQMAKSIDVFMQRSAEAGYQLPLATDTGWLREIENAIERSNY